MNTTVNLSMLVENVTPDLAKSWLETSNGNRPISEVAVNKYMADLRDGRFLLNGEAIKFDDAGRLLDGHHRLVAIAKSGINAAICVIRGLDPKSVVTMDQGRMRSASDQLGMFHKIAAASHKVSTARQVIATERGLTRGNRLSSMELQDFVVQNADGLEKAQRVGWRAKEKMRANQTVFAASYFRIAAVDPVKADEFFDSLINGAGLQDGSPILATRNSLITDPKRGGYQARQIETIFRGWNFWRAGEARKLIRISGELPELA